MTPNYNRRKAIVLSLILLGQMIVAPRSQAASKPFFLIQINPAAFVAPASYTFENSGRDILRGPGYWDFDFTLAKNFPLKFLEEGSFLQVRADSYDLFNHPDFYQPASAVGAIGVGTITSTHTSRSFQLGARIEF